jgi:DNA-binding CsgD family transcriptional regulator
VRSSSPTAWPFVGRDDVLAEVRAALADSEVDAVVVTAPAGTGKTELVRVATADAAVPPLWWRASVATSAVPFGALAELLDLEDEPDPSSAYRRMAAMVADAGGVVVLDDGPALDPRSADLLHRLVEAGKATVAATARSGVEVPAWMEWLWLGDRTRHLELQPLTPTEVEAVVDAAAQPLDRVGRGVLADSLHRRTAGNALLVRELLADALRAHRRGDPLVGDREAPPHLLRVLEARLTASGASRGPLQAVAVVGALPLTVLAEAYGSEAVDEAERTGWIAIDDGPRPLARPAHPLHAEAALASMTAMTRRETAALVAPIVLRTPTATPTERLAATASLVDHGVGAPAEALVDGARVAFAGLDHALAVRLAEAALGQGEDLDAQLVLGAALSAADRPDEAEAVLRAACQAAGTDQARARAAGRLSVHLIAHGARIHEAAELLAEVEASLDDPAAKAFLAADRAKVQSILGDLTTVDTDLPEGSDDLAVLNTAIVGAYAQAMAGDAEGCERTIERALPLAEAHQAVLPWSGELVRFSGPFAALLADGPMAAQARAELGLRTAVGASEPTVGTWRFLVGLTGTVSGELAAAATALAQAVVELDGHDLISARPLARSGHAWVAAQVGDVERARTLIDASIDAAAVDGRVLTQVVAADAWCHVAERGRLSAALETKLVETARAAAAGGQVLSAVLLLHDLIRLGAPATASAELEQLAAHAPPSWLLTIVRERARAEAAGDGAAVGRLQRQVRGRWPVVEAELHERRRTLAAVDDPPAASRHALRAVRCASRLGPLLPITLTQVPAPLTARELEVALAVTAGASNREVAEGAGVSVRTVENQLQSIYRKLAVTDRSELATLIESA